MVVIINVFNIILFDILIEFFKNVILLFCVKERGYNFFINGYVYVVKIYSIIDKIVEIMVKCYWFMKKSEDLYKVNMIIDCNKCVIDDSYCFC